MDNSDRKNMVCDLDKAEETLKETRELVIKARDTLKSARAKNTKHTLKPENH